MKRFTLSITLALLSSLAFGQNFANRVISSGPCNPINAVTCPSGIENVTAIVDADRSNFAVMRSNVGTSLINNTAFVELGFDEKVQGGSVLGIEVGELNQNLNIDVFQQIAVYGYNSLGVEVFSSEDISLQQLGVISNEGGGVILQIPTPLGNYSIARLRVEFTALVNLVQEIAIFNVFADGNCPAIEATTVLNSRNTTNPGAAVDEDPETAAVLDLPISVADVANLSLTFPVAANPGDFVGFKVASADLLLGLGLIENITLVAYAASGQELDRKEDFTISDLIILDNLSGLLGPILNLGGSTNGKAIIGFNTKSTVSEPIKSIKIEVAPIVGVSFDLAVFSGLYYSDQLAMNIVASKVAINDGETVNLIATGNYDSYLWSTGQTGPNITVDKPGLYTVTGTRFDGCEVSASVLVRSSSCNGIDSPFATQVLDFGACDPMVPLICPSGVENPENAVDGDPSTYATLTSTLGASLLETSAFLELGFDNPKAAGSNLSFSVQSLNQTLNADVLDQLVITVFDIEGNVVVKRENINTTDVQLISAESGLSLITIPTPFGAYEIQRVRFEIEALANVVQDLALFSVFADCACPATQATKVNDFANASDVGNIIDNNPNSYATLDLPVGLVDDAFVTLEFSSAAQSGDYVGFVVAANSDVLDAGVIENLTVVLLDDLGNELAQFEDFTLLDLVAAEKAAGILGSVLGLSSGSASPYVLGGIVPDSLPPVKGIKLVQEPVIGLNSSVRVYAAFYQPGTQGIEVLGTSTFVCEQSAATLSAPEGYAGYLWSNGETTREITTNVPGLYGVTVFRDNGCSLFGAYALESNNIEIDAQVTLPTCGNANGNISVDLNVEEGSFEFIWSNGATTPELSNIPSGIYALTVTETTTGCSASEEFIVNDIDAPKFVHWVRHSNCGSNDGAIFLTIPNGAIVNWSNGAETPIIRNLSPGVYIATVTFPNGCKRIEKYTVINQSNFQLSAEVTPSLCSEPTGAINLTIGIPGNYSIAWSNGLDTEDLVGLAPGIYTVIVTNVATGCQDILHLELSTVGAPVIRQLQLVEETCAGDANGMIEIEVTAATDVTVEWNNGEFGPVLENLGPGFFTVRVYDTLGCEANGIFPLVARDAMVTSISSTETGCEPPFDGTAVTSTNGGRAPYFYDWNTGETSSSLSGLGEGEYIVTISDFNGCESILSTLVNKKEICKSDTLPEPEEEKPITVTEDDLFNIYTPNGDGRNDTWVSGLDLPSYDRVGVQFYNIYGDKVYSAHNYQDDWDGTYLNSSDPLPDGTYYYKIRLERGRQIKDLAGFVTIKR
ncbi:gliding motility-associated C-terminal domain-containing protein [Luteibaculum oceani]|uniref:Gliding motility-associated C-terminal domain-containing protein n=1 Tax=Luteibaculum oceani TaxID=1294296 RepID=A0A5C6V982_9FLAO|nr:gliding motility-associated C-terminal domain-containing protein [Luteibaculum oceani]TXC81719.1 gliding motility-associated C-terminal domain-containing protein [Luteibaculum oceani]